MEYDDFGFDVGEGAYHSDEENRKNNEEPFPDELWDKDYERDIEEEVI